MLSRRDFGLGAFFASLVSLLPAKVLADALSQDNRLVLTLGPNVDGKRNLKSVTITENGYTSKLDAGSMRDLGMAMQKEAEEQGEWTAMPLEYFEGCPRPMSQSKFRERELV